MTSAHNPSKQKDATSTSTTSTSTMTEEGMTAQQKSDYKRMVRDIEDAGGLQYMSFVDICDGDEVFYGKPNSDRRKWFQKKVNLLKRLRPDSYLRRVRKLGVTPGDATVEYGNSGAAPSFTDINDINDEEDDDDEAAAAVAVDEDCDEEDDDEEEYDDDDDDEDNKAVHDLSKLLSSIGVSSSTGSGLTSGTSSVRGKSVTPPRSGRKTPPRVTTPPRSTAQARVIEFKMNAIRGARGAIGQPTTVQLGNGTVETFVGSKIAPQRIDVNVLFPERNYPFLIEVVPEVLEGSLPLTIFDISAIVDYPDVNKWVAKIPKGKPHNRVLFQIPSLRYWHTVMEVYHKKLTCETTKTKHKSTATAVTEDEERQSFWIMLNFPGVEVENVVISKSRNNVKSVLNVMKHKPAHIGQDLVGTGLAWRIAVKEEVDRAVEGTANFDLKNEFNK